MSYIIVQTDGSDSFFEIDALINEEGTAIQTFDTEEEAKLFLAQCGVQQMPFGYPFDISIMRIH